MRKGPAMNAQKMAGVLGGIIGSVVLIAAFAQNLKETSTNIPKQIAKIETPKALVRGPVVRDITP
jgi:hypothetical protein